MPTIISGDGTITGLTSTGISAAQTVSASNITTGTLPFAQLPTGSVLQVVQTVKTNIFTSSATTFTDITGMSVSITPKFSTSKILVIANLSAGIELGGDGFSTLLLRDSTNIYIGDANGSNYRASAGTGRIGGGGSIGQTSLMYLDSPATTSSVTYKLQARNGATGGTWKVNVNNDNNSADATKPTAASSITVMEIAA